MKATEFYRLMDIIKYIPHKEEIFISNMIGINSAVIHTKLDDKITIYYEKIKQEDGAEEEYNVGE
jgi:hypothetical protein